VDEVGLIHLAYVPAEPAGGVEAELGGDRRRAACGIGVPGNGPARAASRVDPPLGRDLAERVA
jgi:hypothetical protein